MLGVSEATVNRDVSVTNVTKSEPESLIIKDAEDEVVTNVTKSPSFISQRGA